jgi:hypothetical protein
LKAHASKRFQTGFENVRLRSGQGLVQTGVLIPPHVVIGNLAAQDLIGEKPSRHRAKLRHHRFFQRLSRRRNMIRICFLRFEAAGQIGTQQLCLAHIDSSTCFSKGWPAAPGLRSSSCRRIPSVF